MRVAHLGGGIFRGNMGINALTYSAIKLVEAAGRQAGVAIQHNLLEYTPAWDIPAALGQYDVSYRQLRPQLASLLAGRYWHQRRLFREFDLYLASVAGDSFTDLYGTRRFHGMCRFLRRAVRSGKPFVFLPQTIGPFATQSARRAAGRLLAAASAVFTRDPESADCVRKMGGRIRHFESVDMALFLDYPPASKAGNESIRVGINVSGLLWNGGYDRKNMFNLRFDYQEFIRRLIAWFQSRPGTTVELISHVLCAPYYYPIEDDYAVCKQLALSSGCVLGPYFLTPVEAKSWISGLDFLVGSRMHCCVAGYSSGVPTVPVAYSRKFRGLFKGALSYDTVADATEQSLDEVLAVIARAFERRHELRAELALARQKLQRLERELVANLALAVRQVATT